MAQVVVAFLLERLNDFIASEAQLLCGVRKDPVWIRDELQRIKVFLQSADKKKARDEKLKDWVRCVREVSYDADDILDGFNIQMKNYSNVVDKIVA
ncbi:hypothetical protein AMTR_s00061p00111020 [Amborella trichopoda]|uniref:Disease resistance N-terminal domain-containing protein n=1 Tax=Amborella trichopoda TaxID=13333 RepID=U5DCD8_AMBTC|nr:hypothetical protein AMTR_s00061p00111020 [Amborella trichopoda]